MSDAEQTLLVEEHQRIQRRLRFLRFAIPGVAALIVVGNLWSMASEVQELDTDALATQIEARSNHLMPRVEEHFNELARALQPVFAAEMDKQAATLAPRVDAALTRQMTLLQQNVEARFTKQLDAAWAASQGRQRNMLVAAIPDLAGNHAAQDRIMQSMKDSLMRFSMKQLAANFHEHVVAMEGIRKTLQRSYAGAGADAQADDALMIWIELMHETVGGDDTILGAGPAGAVARK